MAARDSIASRFERADRVDVEDGTDVARFDGFDREVRMGAQVAQRVAARQRRDALARPRRKPNGVAGLLRRAADRRRRRPRRHGRSFRSAPALTSGLSPRSTISAHVFAQETVGQLPASATCPVSGSAVAQRPDDVGSVRKIGADLGAGQRRPDPSLRAAAMACSISGLPRNSINSFCFPMRDDDPAARITARSPRSFDAFSAAHSSWR